MVKLKLSLPKDFLNGEERCGYYISPKMKEVWAVELDLLAELQRVCLKYQIQYFASGGTMLGAVRHKGFIPWDDDIDIMMIRSEYQKLCEVADKEFKHPYFFQTEYTDRGSLRGHAVLKNSETTGALKSEIKFCKFNQGIGIDIFPLDSVVDDEIKFVKQGQKVEKLKRKINFLASVTERYNPEEEKNLKGKLKTCLKKVLDVIPLNWKDYDKLYQEFENTCMKYNDEKTERISTLSFQFMNRQHIKYRKDYEKLIEVDFEFMKIPIGSNYDHALKTRYGDYLTYEIGSSCHGDVIFDTEKSYTEYINV